MLCIIFPYIFGLYPGGGGGGGGGQAKSHKSDDDFLPTSL